jgi:hypothetical protein
MSDVMMARSPRYLTMFDAVASVTTGSGRVAIPTDSVSAQIGKMGRGSSPGLSDFSDIAARRLQKKDQEVFPRIDAIGELDGR